MYASTLTLVMINCICKNNTANNVKLCPQL